LGRKEGQILKKEKGKKNTRGKSELFVSRLGRGLQFRKGVKKDSSLALLQFQLNKKGLGDGKKNSEPNWGGPTLKGELKIGDA